MKFFGVFVFCMFFISIFAAFFDVLMISDSGLSDLTYCTLFSVYICKF